MAHNYSLRTRRGRDYRQLSTIELPREHKTSSQDKLYLIEVLERDGSRAKIHYVGYDSSDDEWCDVNEIVGLPSTSSSKGESSNNIPIHLPYNVYNELLIKIKQSLIFGRKQSPLVAINMGFDYLLFMGGLQAFGIPKQRAHGHQQYQLKNYHDLDPLLDRNWHFRGLNSSGDYAFVVLNTVTYSIHKRRKITECYPSHHGDNVPQDHMQDTGYALKFCFVRTYGNHLHLEKTNTYLTNVTLNNSDYVILCTQIY